MRIDLKSRFRSASICPHCGLVAKPPLHMVFAKAIAENCNECGGRILAEVSLSWATATLFSMVPMIFFHSVRGRLAIWLATLLVLGVIRILHGRYIKYPVPISF